VYVDVNSWREVQTFHSSQKFELLDSLERLERLERLQPTAMDQEEYLKNRVDDQIAWYDRKSASNQRWFYRLRMIEIVAAAAIPLLAGYAAIAVELRIIIGVLGAVVAVIAGVLALYQFQENWTAYRSTCESLKQEKHLFLTRTEPYHDSDAFPLFVHRIEGLMAEQRAAWMQNIGGANRDKTQE
jgi:hypothetical protein